MTYDLCESAEQTVSAEKYEKYNAIADTSREKLRQPIVSSHQVRFWIRSRRQFRVEAEHSHAHLE